MFLFSTKGDQVVSVNGQSVNGKSYSQVIELIVARWAARKAIIGDVSEFSMTWSKFLSAWVDRNEQILQSDWSKKWEKFFSSSLWLYNVLQLLLVFNIWVCCIGLCSFQDLSGCEMLWVFFHSQELLELGIIPKEDCVLQMVRNSSFFLFFHYSVIY